MGCCKACLRFTLICVEFFRTILAPCRTVLIGCLGIRNLVLRSTIVDKSYVAEYRVNSINLAFGNESGVEV